MESMQAIKNRIQRIGSTKQITQAMHLVSSTKIVRAKARMESARPYFLQARQVLSSIARHAGDYQHAYLSGHGSEQGAAVFVVASDQGLCGGYNINVSKAAIDVIKQTNSRHVVAVGRRAKDYLHRRGYRVLHCFEGVTQNPFYEEAKEIAELALAFYNSRQVNAVYLVYTEYFSMIHYVPKAVRLLPLAPQETEEQTCLALSASTLFEPAQAKFLNLAVPQYLAAYLYGAMTESAVCEQSARITSMDDAVKNSTDLIEDLTLQYNRVRQGAITQELTEIVGGYNAL